MTTAAKENTQQAPVYQRKRCLIITIIGGLGQALLVAAVVMALHHIKEARRSLKERFNTQGTYQHAGVSTTALDCSQIGKDILMKGGSAADSAVAAMFCLGVVNIHSSGIGGGGFLVLYKREEKKFYLYDYRDQAPMKAKPELFLNKSDASRYGGLSIAVPGSVKGLYTVWKDHGKLPWAELLNPSIQLARVGIKTPPAVVGNLNWMLPRMIDHNAGGLLSLVTKSGGLPLNTYDTMVNKELANTLEAIKINPMSFYDGPLADKIVKDIQGAGGVVTHSDLKNYQVKMRKKVDYVLGNGIKMTTMPPPSGGAIVAMIMNILSGYNIGPNSTLTIPNYVEYLHQFLEASKFAFAERAHLGDPDFVKDMYKKLADMTNPKTGLKIRKKIWMNQTHDMEYYGGGFIKEDHGTTHVSLLAENGDAVACTETINYVFGSLVRSSDTGILYNNVMNDFSIPGEKNVYHLPHFPENDLKPGKRPMSSMSPTIVTDPNGDVRLVTGAAGGPRIITSTALTMLRTLFIGQKLVNAVKDSRMHTQLAPNEVTYYKDLAPNVELIKGLERKNHTVTTTDSVGVVHAVMKVGNSLQCVADPRRYGVPDGY